ncbi:SMODS domain-containing nucleotidyltransferase [Bacillus sp. E214]|uniref:SMODS domain-containing nucleotidyltransferase n=1 Tax=Bacillus sp. E214 TaxID=2587156 RepID=UPI0011DFEB5D|nr:nucleotidyltransferase [Bacillus sp. E214]
MSVNNYFSTLSSHLVLSSMENANIRTSIANLAKNLNYYFNQGQLLNHFQFGSSTRGTILPRIVDLDSDIDYMVVFKNPRGYTPETLLKYLKNFMHTYYGHSEIYKDNPTMVLELNHIKFELVPAIQDDWGNYSIPSKQNILSRWIPTDPMGFNEKITRVNVYNNSRIKPLVRLMKYWNTNKLEGYYYSFELENTIVQKYEYNSKGSLKEYVYDIFESMNPRYDDSQRFKERLARAKDIINDVKWHEQRGKDLQAREIIKNIFPEV